MPLKVASFMPYFSYDGALRVRGLMRIREPLQGNQIVDFDLMGIDPECKSTLPQVPNACGIHVHSATACVGDAGDHLWNRGAVDYDPWQTVRYTTYLGGSFGSFRLYTGMTNTELSNHVVVVHDHSGVRISCAELVSPVRLVVKPLWLYPGYMGALRIRGEIEISQQGDGMEAEQVLRYKLSNLDSDYHRYGVIHGDFDFGMHIHHGMECSGRIGDRLWNNNVLEADPWPPVKYYSNGENATGSVSVTTGLRNMELADRVIILYDSRGYRASCGKLKAPTTLTVSSVQPYWRYNGRFNVSGRIRITQRGVGAGTTQILRYDLAGVDPSCGAARVSNGVAAPAGMACALAVHLADSCEEEAGDLAWDSILVQANPWLSSTYISAPDGTAMGSGVKVTTGLSNEDLADKVFIVNDAAGVKIACGVLKVGSELLEFTEEEYVPRTICHSEQDWREQNWMNFTGLFSRCGPNLICVTGQAECQEHCTEDAQCENFPMRVCSKENWKCTHKGLLGRSGGTDIGAAILFFFISGLALSAGIGGGGLYVPLLMVILHFKVREATGLSQACLAGGASTALCYNARQRHPSGHKPMIDYDLVLVMGPNLLIGALLGSALNTAFPSWLILVLLVCILSHSAWKAMRKAVDTWRKESKGEVPGLPDSGDARLRKNFCQRLLKFFGGGRHYAEFNETEHHKKAVPADEAGAPPQMFGFSVGADDGDDYEDLHPHVPVRPRYDEEEDTIRQICNQADTYDLNSRIVDGLADGTGQPQFPRGKLMLFFTMWAVVVVSILARGGRATPGIVDYCSVGYWLLPFFTVGLLLVVSISAAMRAVKTQAGAPPAPTKEGGLEWTAKTARQIIVWSWGAGTIAALCGIGGGMVMGPKLLSLGFLPQVQASTTATTLFVLSSSTALAFLVQGTSPLDYAIFLAVFTGMGAVIGKAMVDWVVKRFRRPSVIMFILGGIIALSVVVLFIIGAVDIANDDGRDTLFKSFCRKLEDDDWEGR